MYEWSQYAIDIKIDHDFDDFREVQRYLRIRMLVKQRVNRANEELMAKVFSSPSYDIGSYPNGLHSVIKTLT